MQNETRQNLSGSKTGKSSDIIFWVALGGIGLSALLHVIKKNPQHPLIDLCAAPFVLWKLYAKISKEGGRQSE